MLRAESAGLPGTLVGAKFVQKPKRSLLRVGLNLVPQLFSNNRIMLAFEGFTLVDRYAAIDAIGQKVIEITALEVAYLRYFFAALLIF